MAIIAICDDNEIQLRSAAEAVHEYNLTLPDDAVHFSVRTFTSARQLWFEMADQKIADLFLLDIDMPEMSGLELAEKIREIGPRTLILFLTSHTEYALQGYKVDAFRFIPKDRLKEELPEALRAAEKELSRTREYVSISEDVFSYVYHWMKSFMFSVPCGFWRSIPFIRGSSPAEKESKNSSILLVPIAFYLSIAEPLWESTISKKSTIQN